MPLPAPFAASNLWPRTPLEPIEKPGLPGPVCPCGSWGAGQGQVLSVPPSRGCPCPHSPRLTGHWNHRLTHWGSQDRHPSVGLTCRRMGSFTSSKPTTAVVQPGRGHLRPPRGCSAVSLWPERRQGQLGPVPRPHRQLSPLCPGTGAPAAFVRTVQVVGHLFLCTKWRNTGRCGGKLEQRKILLI